MVNLYTTNVIQCLKNHHYHDVRYILDICYLLLLFCDYL